MKPTFFEGLGRATLRGVRKCSKCGTKNGTRGLSCKNKNCKYIFSEGNSSNCSSRQVQQQQLLSLDNGEGGDERKCLVKSSRLYEITRLVSNTTNTNTDFGTLYSLRRKNKGVFVTYKDSLLEGSASSSSCSCSSSSNLCSSSPSFPCDHVKYLLSAKEPIPDSIPFTLKVSVLNSLRVTDGVKHEIWLRAKEPGPLVQRVSRSTFVIRGAPNASSSSEYFPYVHLSFLRRKNYNFSYICSCLKASCSKNYFCSHLYSILTVFLGDEKLSFEFRNYISFLESFIISSSDFSSSSTNTEVLEILGQCHESENIIKVEVLERVQSSSSPIETSENTETDSNSQTFYSFSQEPNEIYSILESQTQMTSSPSSSSLSFFQKRKDEGRRQSLGIGSLDSQSYSFLDWLSSVSERINQTMHYQFDGKPEPLTFHAPQSFFDILLADRISLGVKKKRLPNSTTSFLRKESLPLGLFTKYTWSLNNVLHVKQIFETPNSCLELTRNFIERPDGSFEHIRRFESIGSSSSGSGKIKIPSIRPQTLKTYLKVGVMSGPDERCENTPFIIEWIPDILPASKVGELRIQFEYGHSRNGVPERRNPLDSLFSLN